jgi:sulfoxide reductase heme-binding subunit YedZ
MPNRAIPYVKTLIHLICLLLMLLLLNSLRPQNIGADPILHLTHVTGEWAIWFLLISLAITPIRRLHPRLSNLIRFRRLLGLYAFFYATLHLCIYVFLFSGYDFSAAIDGLRAGHLAEPFHQLRLIWPKMLDDIEKRRFIQVGFLAWTILLALALTSPAFILRKMGGKPWQTLHRLVYVAAICACIHYVWLVKPGVRDPLLETSVLAVLLAARLVYVALKKRNPPAPKAAPPIAV